VKKFLTAHEQKITGVLSCFDRILFTGHLPISSPGGMGHFMYNLGVPLKDFKPFVRQHTEAFQSWAKDYAQRHHRPYLDPRERRTDKETCARQIAQRDGIQKGLVCVLPAIESGHTFKLAFRPGGPMLRAGYRPGMVFYFYFVDPCLGWLYVRVQSWFPFTTQVCLNGHEMLARKLTRHRITFKQEDNAFTEISDFPRAQRLANRLFGRNFHLTLSSLAARVQPLLRTLFKGMDYYWVTDQAEYATDVVFSSARALAELYPRLAQHAMLNFSPESVLSFLGRRLHKGLAGQIIGRFMQTFPGLRLKHKVKKNWIKMYNKAGCILRVETVINHSRDFKIRRAGIRKGHRVLDWFPMKKGVSTLWRYAIVSRAANGRYLNALACVADPTQANRELRQLAQPAIHNGRSQRGFNPASKQDAELFAAALRGEHALLGLRNRDIREQLFAPPRDAQAQRRQSASVSRLLKRLHRHGLIAKITRTRRWRVTDKGQRLMSASLALHRDHLVQQPLRKKAAA
jgi:hypothetical protein